MAKNLGKSIALIVLILLLVAGAGLWFDYLGVIDIKNYIAPIIRLPFVERIVGNTARSQPAAPPGAFISLESERLAVRLEALELREDALDKRDTEQKTRNDELLQLADALDERERGLTEQRESIENERKAAQGKDVVIEQNARWLNGMPPQAAVGIIAAMQDQDAIDILRKTEEIARNEGTSSIVSFWLSLMPPARAAELQRKMALRSD